jgi:hypothetical protein
MNTMEFCINQACVGEIARHLRACEKCFVDQLGLRVDIDDYAQKIVARAERFEARSEGKLVGLLAAYCNDPLQKRAFITLPISALFPTGGGKGWRHNSYRS